MLSATRRWFRRNRTYIAVGTAVVGSTYVVGQYVLSKITESRERAQLDRIAKDNIRRRFEQNQIDCTITVVALLPDLLGNAIHAFPCELILAELENKRAERLARASAGGNSEASSLRDGDTASLSSFHTGSFVHASQLAESTAPRKSRAQLWNELKIASVTRAFTLIYAISLLILLTRIQLNLLGRMSYLQSVITLAQPPAAGRNNSISLEDHDDADATLHFGVDRDTHRKLLTYSWWIMNRGYTQLIEKVRPAVEEVFGSVSPAEGITADRMRELVMGVRKKVEGSTEQDRYATRWLPFVLPPREEEESMLIESGVITPPSTSSAQSPQPTSNSGPNATSASYMSATPAPLRQLLDETADLIDSPSFSRVNTLILNSMFSLLIDKKVIQSSYPQPNPHSPPASEASAPLPRIQELDSSITVVPAEPRVKLASLLAIITRQATVIGSSVAPNEYVAAVEGDVRELESFAAVIYTHNLNQHAEETRPKTADSQQLRTADGTGVSDVGAEQVDGMVESKLESAWSKVVGSTSFSTQ